MKRFFIFPLCLISFAISNHVSAEKADANKPLRIEADQMAYDDAKQINTFSGNVVLTKGTLTMRGGKLTVTQDPAGYQFATLVSSPGAVATFRQKRDGGQNLWIEGEAERLEYDGKAEVVKLFSKARIRRLDGTRPLDEVEGEFIAYDSRAEFFSVNSTLAGSGKAGKGRITATIQPRTEAGDN